MLWCVLPRRRTASLLDLVSPIRVRPTLQTADSGGTCVPYQGMNRVFAGRRGRALAREENGVSPPFRLPRVWFYSVTWVRPWVLKKGERERGRGERDEVHVCYLGFRSSLFLGNTHIHTHTGPKKRCVPTACAKFDTRQHVQDKQIERAFKKKRPDWSSTLTCKIIISIEKG